MPSTGRRFRKEGVTWRGGDRETRGLGERKKRRSLNEAEGERGRNGK
jgi:hypothetical protein